MEHSTCPKLAIHPFLAIGSKSGTILTFSCDKILFLESCHRRPRGQSLRGHGAHRLLIPRASLRYHLASSLSHLCNCLTPKYIIAPSAKAPHMPPTIDPICPAVFSPPPPPPVLGAVLGVAVGGIFAVAAVFRKTTMAYTIVAGGGFNLDGDLPEMCRAEARGVVSNKSIGNLIMMHAKGE